MNRYIQQMPIRAHDLDILMDALDQETLFYHKTKAYAPLLYDKASIRVVEDISSHHKQCFDAISDYLNNPF